MRDRILGLSDETSVWAKARDKELQAEGIPILIDRIESNLTELREAGLTEYRVDDGKVFVDYKGLQPPFVRALFRLAGGYFENDGGWWELIKIAHHPVAPFPVHRPSY